MSISDSSLSLGAGQAPDLTPSSNTGVTGKNSVGSFAYSIDWLRYSVLSEVGALDALPPLPAFYPSGEVVRPLRYYNRAVALTCGRVDWNEDKPSQKMLVNLSGAECSAAVLLGVDLARVLEWALVDVRGKFTRLDFAVDVFADVDVMSVKRAWDAGELVTSAQGCEDVGKSGAGGADLGRTVYLGARSSDGFVRFYDKAKREGVAGPWVRVEGEFKGDLAQAVARSMLVQGIIPAGKAALRLLVECPTLPWLTAALAGDEGAYIQPMVRKETNRQRWYREQIIPAIEGDLRQGNQWLRFQLLRVLEDLDEVEQHGPFVPLENSPKAFKGAQVLAREGFAGPDFRRGFERAGKDAVVLLLRRLGYRWNTQLQEWEREGGDTSAEARAE